EGLRQAPGGKARRGAAEVGGSLFLSQVRCSWPRFDHSVDDWGRLPSRSLGILEAVMDDTSQPALARYYELLRARTPLARLARAADLSSAVRQLAESSIRAAQPDASLEVVRARLALRLYGREVAARLFPGVELDVG